MLSPLDDLPIHQIAEPVRHVGTSDRNFYDRYYFNCHPCNDELFLIAGMGQYPNLSVTDAFAVVLHADQHRVAGALLDRRRHRPMQLHLCGKSRRCDAGRID